MPRRSPLIAIAAGLLAAGCGATGPVGITPPHPIASIEQRCEALGRVLPAKLVGLDARRTSPHSPLTHAWGTPAVTLACGVPKPSGYRPNASSTLAVNNLLWFETIQGSKVIWTAIRPGTTKASTMYVQLSVPRAYPAADAFLTALTGTIKAADTPSS